MAGCNQAGGAEPQSPGDDSEPSTVTSIEQVSHVCLQCCLIKHSHFAILNASRNAWYGNFI